MPSFRTLDLRSVYRSDRDNILRDFYIPTLSVAVAYDRAVGYFSAGALWHAAQGISALVRRDGRMRLVVGGELQPADASAIARGYELLESGAFLEKTCEEVVSRIADALFQRRVQVLSWLIAAGRLDVRVAYKRRGMYHEKIGILRDEFGDQVVFQGSANETVSALLPEFNFESINVFQCWRPELADHYRPYVEGFEALWENRVPDAVVLPFPEAASQQLVKLAGAGSVITPESELALAGHEVIVVSTGPSIPDTLEGLPFEIRKHQQAALRGWKQAEYQGILQLATGAGKTVCAAYAIVKCNKAFRRLFVVVAVPYQNLADQWVEALAPFGVTPIQAYAATERWLEPLGRMVTLYLLGQVDFVCLVVVNHTLQSESFQRLLVKVPGENLLWIGDECHHHGTLALSRSLPAQARMRLGLSATPFGIYGGVSDERIRSYYGAVAYAYGLEEAIRDGVLTPYQYRVVPVALTDDEAEEYVEISRQIARAIAGGGEVLDADHPARMLLYRRSRLLGVARNKLRALGSELLGRVGPRSHTLVYCGDGTYDEAEDGAGAGVLRQVEAVSELLQEQGWRNAHFTSQESRDERRRTLDSFRLGMVDALVAIRCLDEGIDVPACRSAFLLASSRNPRQFVQRRGRLLRRSPGKSSAYIVDFLVEAPRSGADQIERRLVGDELERVAEFARTASNYADVVRDLMPLLRRYDLAHYLA